MHPATPSGLWRDDCGVKELQICGLFVTIKSIIAKLAHRWSSYCIDNQR